MSDTANRAAPALVERLCNEIETMWDERRDWTVVTRLADQHPAVADLLFEFFELIIESELDDLFDDENTRQVADESADLSAISLREWYERVGRSIALEAERDALRNIPGSSTGPAGTPAATGGAPEETEGTASPLTDVGQSPAPPGPRPAAPVVPAAHQASATDGSSTGTLRLALLGYLRAKTRRSAETIAHDLSLNLNFLILVSRHPEALPSGWCREIRQRVKCVYQDETAPVGVPHADRGGYRIAAFRDRAYDPTRMTPDKILERAALPPAEAGFWRRLAAECDAPAEETPTDGGRS